MDSRILKVKIKGDSMWPTFNDGDVIACEQYDDQTVSVGDLVVFTHPFKNGITCVKRVKSLSEKGYFVEGDNPDPLASEDSHNFGLVSKEAVFAYKKE